jgi:hypothetical protein
MLVFVSVFAAAIPNGVVNSFSTVIIHDLGFTTTMTTQLKSVGDAVQIIALIISGVIILNVPNCVYPPPYVYVRATQPVFSMPLRPTSFAPSQRCVWLTFSNLTHGADSSASVSWMRNL